MIDLPFTPSGSTNLPSIVFVILGIVAGIALGIGTAIFLELFDTTIRRRQQLEDAQLPVITAIPKISL